MPQPAPAYVQALRDSIRPRSFEGTTLCFVRAVGETAIEASFDFGATWHDFPLTEIVSAETVRTVTFQNASYELVRLFLREDHPTIEIAALTAQVRHLQGKDRSCGCGERKAARTSAARDLHCDELCRDKVGCDWWDCMFWCIFFREP